MNIIQEQSKDHSKVFPLIEKAFLKKKHSNHQEQFLVEQLRKSEAFTPELSLIAKIENKIVSQILLSKIKIINEYETTPSLALSLFPCCQSIKIKVLAENSSNILII